MWVPVRSRVSRRKSDRSSDGATSAFTFLPLTDISIFICVLLLNLDQRPLAKASCCLRCSSAFSVCSIAIFAKHGGTLPPDPAGIVAPNRRQSTAPHTCEENSSEEKSLTK